MVVKSATKKRLMELGVEEEYAHKLATDRNMADIKQLSLDEVASCVSLSKDDEKFTALMDVIREVGATRRKRRSKKITINAKAVDDDDFPVGLTKFNVLNHELVPHQELVPIEDEVEVLAPWGLMRFDEDTGGDRLAKELLPKVLITDPVVQVIKEMQEKEDLLLANADPDHVPLAAGWLADRVLKVKRHSLSAGTSVAYRLIVEGN